MTSLELARYFGHPHMYDILSPIIRSAIPYKSLRLLEEQFHSLIRDELTSQVVDELHLQLPQLEYLTEMEGDLMYFALSEHKYQNAVSPTYLLEGKELIVTRVSCSVSTDATSSFE